MMSCDFYFFIGAYGKWEAPPEPTYNNEASSLNTDKDVQLSNIDIVNWDRLYGHMILGRDVLCTNFLVIRINDHD